MNERLIRRFFLILIIGIALLSAGCSAAENETAESKSAPSSEEKEAVSGGVVADLATPPPGSQATQEKWDSFDEAKRQESWDKYLASLESGGSDEAQTDEDSTVKVSTNVKPVSVVTSNLMKAPMDIYYYGIGEIEAGEVSKIFPEISGTAINIYVVEGDYVDAGDLLFSLDSREWVREIERAEEKWGAELNIAEIKLNEASREMDRINTFYSRDLATKAELDKAEQMLNEAQLNMQKVQLSRETELESLQENYKSRLGISPVRGWVSNISFSEGEIVNTADFVEIVNLEEVQLTVDVPENIIPRIKRGAPVAAKTTSASKYGMQGEITGYSVVPENNRTYKVRASIVNKNQRLFPGMLMEVQIQISQLQPNFVVPRSAVVTEGIDNFIFFVDNGQSVRVPVELGSSRQGYLQVVGNLSEGDELVIEGQSYLKPGTPVNVTDSRAYLTERMEF